MHLESIRGKLNQCEILRLEGVYKLGPRYEFAQSRRGLFTSTYLKVTGTQNCDLNEFTGHSAMLAQCQLRTTPIDSSATCHLNEKDNNHNCEFHSRVLRCALSWRDD